MQTSVTFHYFSISPAEAWRLPLLTADGASNVSIFTSLLDAKDLVLLRSFANMEQEHIGIFGLPILIKLTLF